MRKITLSEYNAIPENYRGIWTVERWDLPDWAVQDLYGQVL